MFIFTYYIVRDDEIILRPKKSDIVFKEDKKLSALSFHSANFKISCLAWRLPRGLQCLKSIILTPVLATGSKKWKSRKWSVLCCCYCHKKAGKVYHNNTCSDVMANGSIHKNINFLNINVNVYNLLFLILIIVVLLFSMTCIFILLISLSMTRRLTGYFSSIVVHASCIPSQVYRLNSHPKLTKIFA